MERGRGGKKNGKENGGGKKMEETGERVGGWVGWFGDDMYIDTKMIDGTRGGGGRGEDFMLWTA